ncbi:MAG: hypothetical protein JWM82_1907 [Myxococcales bacterium]|jgi:hypothetical protein|nr:hypothetical protein [Myxococcales bacterium]
MIRSPSVVLAGFALCVALGEARAENDEASTDGAIEIAALPSLTPPALLRGLAPPPRHVTLPDGRAARDPSALSLDLSLSYLRLAVHGDGTPGLSTFLGTSTTALGGFRLRF